MSRKNMEEEEHGGRGTWRMGRRTMEKVEEEQHGGGGIEGRRREEQQTEETYGSSSSSWSSSSDSVACAVMDSMGVVYCATRVLIDLVLWGAPPVHTDRIDRLMG